MSIKSRLSQLQKQAGVATRPGERDGIVTPKPSLSDLRKRIAQLESRGRSRTARPGGSTECMSGSAEALAEQLEGTLCDGGLIHIRKRVPLQGRLGSVCLSGGLRNQTVLPGETGSVYRHVYIDTETTGLSGGSGTLAFLVGIAVVETDTIELNQFLITGFSAEAVSLQALARYLTPGDRLVSYNGKSYDLPLLLTRFRMQGLRHPFDGLPHLDLLHPVRRLFGKRWDDCRLITLEKKLLGFHRVDDLPGSEAPEAWFSYIRHGRTANLVKVVEHNRQDIVSLAVAHSVLAQAIEQPHDFDVDLHGLARWLMEVDENAARRLLQSQAHRLCDDGQRLLGHLLRRSGNWALAVDIWEQLAARGCTDSLERLAKYHEHVSKDLAAAKRCCERLPVNATQQHRNRRLAGKLARRPGEDVH